MLLIIYLDCLSLFFFGKMLTLLVILFSLKYTADKPRNGIHLIQITYHAQVHSKAARPS